MSAQNKGHIIQIGSALAYRSIPLQSAYCGAKAAIRGFTDALRSELIHSKSTIRLTMVHLPAVNTPQFEWSRNKLPRTTRPVAPVYQPEAIAEAIYKASLLAPRELWVGISTVQSILGNMFFPGWLDKLMSKKAWGGQMQSEPHPINEDDNLYTPVEGHHTSKGKFSGEAKDSVIAIDPARTGKVALTMFSAVFCALLWRKSGRKK